MNDRRFAAMHDRHLDPPDEDFDDSDDDEIDIAELHKQQQRDREDWLAETMRQRQECEE